MTDTALEALALAVLGAAAIATVAGLLWRRARREDALDAALERDALGCFDRDEAGPVR